MQLQYLICSVDAAVDKNIVLISIKESPERDRLELTNDRFLLWAINKYGKSMFVEQFVQVSMGVKIINCLRKN